MLDPTTIIKARRPCHDGDAQHHRRRCEADWLDQRNREARVEEIRRRVEAEEAELRRLGRVDRDGNAL